MNVCAQLAQDAPYSGGGMVWGRHLRSSCYQGGFYVARRLQFSQAVEGGSLPRHRSSHVYPMVTLVACQARMSDFESEWNASCATSFLRSAGSRTDLRLRLFASSCGQYPLCKLACSRKWPVSAGAAAAGELRAFVMAPPSIRSASESVPSGVELLKLGAGQPNPSSRCIVFKMRDLAGSGNWQHDRTPLQHPGERHLSWLCVVRPRDDVHCASRLCEVACCQGIPRNKADSVCGAVVQHLLIPARCQIVLILHCRHGENSLGSLNVGDQVAIQTCGERITLPTRSETRRAPPESICRARGSAPVTSMHRNALIFIRKNFLLTV